MTALTHRQRVAVNAALAMVHASGRDASAITREAKGHQAQGHTSVKAYEAALHTFTRANPTMARAIQKTMSVVCASSDATVDRYHYAITRYNETGNDDAINSLAPTMAQDSVALALRNGEITQADLANGGIETAMGYAPTPEMVAAVMATAPAASPFASPTAATANAPASQAPTHAPVRRTTDVGTEGTQAAIARLSAPTHGKTGAALARWHGLPMAFVEAQQENGSQES